MKTKLGPVWPCVPFWRLGRGTTPAKPQTSLVGAVWGGVNESGGSGQPQVREKWFCLHLREAAERSWDRQKKKNAGPAGPAKAGH